MITSTLLDRVKGNVTFARFEDSELWYVCADGFEFPIPLSDTAGACFMPEDKGMFFMRWIKKHMTMLDEARVVEYPAAEAEDDAAFLKEYKAP